MEGFKDQVMNLLNGSEALSGDKIMSVISELQPVLPSLKHLKVVSAVVVQDRVTYACTYRLRVVPTTCCSGSSNGISCYQYCLSSKLRFK
jgi:hypothetical protein